VVVLDVNNNNGPSRPCPFEFENESILIVEPYRVLMVTITLELFKTVPSDCRQIQLAGRCANRLHALAESLHDSRRAATAETGIAFDLEQVCVGMSDLHAMRQDMSSPQDRQ